MRIMDDDLKIHLASEIQDIALSYIGQDVETTYTFSDTSTEVWIKYELKIEHYGGRASDTIWIFRIRQMDCDDKGRSYKVVSDNIWYVCDQLFADIERDEFVRKNLGLFRKD